jgi:hypothetical protein
MNRQYDWLVVTKVAVVDCAFMFDCCLINVRQAPIYICVAIGCRLMMKKLESQLLFEFLDVEGIVFVDINVKVAHHKHMAFEFFVLVHFNMLSQKVFKMVPEQSS